MARKREHICRTSASWPDKRGKEKEQKKMIGSFVCTLKAGFLFFSFFQTHTKRSNHTMLVLPGGCAFHKFSQNVTSFHKFSPHENCYKIVKAGEKW